MKKLKILISALSVMALMCFANLASAQASYLLTTDGAATYPTQVVQVNAAVVSPLQGNRTLTLTLPTGALTADLNTKAMDSNTGSSIVVSTNNNQIVIEVENDVDLKNLSNQFFNNGIAIGKEILMQLQ